MSDRVFLDTNIFVYAVDNADADKQKLAQTVLRTTSDAAVSTQVMNEFYVVTTRKLARPLSPAVAAAVIAEMANLVCVTVDGFAHGTVEGHPSTVSDPSTNLVSRSRMRATGTH